MKFKKLFVEAVVFALCVLFIAGCAKGIKFANKASFKATDTELTLVINADEFDKLNEFEALARVDFSGSTCYDEILAWKSAHPQTEVIYTVSLPNGQVMDMDTAELDLSDTAAEDLNECLALMKYLPELRGVKLGQTNGRYDAQALGKFAAENPEIKLEGSAELLGKAYDLNTESLDLSALKHDETAQVLEVLPFFYNIKSIDLGSESVNDLSFDDVAAIEDAAPDAEFSYIFTVFGREINVNMRKLNFSQLRMDDNGERVRAAMKCMKKCDYLDMDSCGVDSEHMAVIRDENPDKEVIWRVNFGTKYSVRTNVETILASDSFDEGELTDENDRELMYCTKVKNLDIGHNLKITNIDFVKYMPDLEVLVTCVSWNMKDIEPLRYCTKLEYLELISAELIEDLSPLSELHELRHLNICNCFAIKDISPLYGLTQLERLWIGCRNKNITAEQVAKMQECAPNCVINTTVWEPTDDPFDYGWRYSKLNTGEANEWHPRYDQLRKTFRYIEAPYSYSFRENDPYFTKPAPTPED